MAAPEYVPGPVAEKPRVYQSPPRRPGPWTNDRPGDFDGPQPVGPGLGVPGPDQGYVLKLARRFEGQLHLTLGEHEADSMSGCATVALKRASIFGRAPVLHDMTLALAVWGCLGEGDDELASLRRRMFEEVSHPHRYQQRRAIADAVPEQTLRMTPAQVRLQMATDWRPLISVTSPIPAPIVRPQAGTIPITPASPPASPAELPVVEAPVDEAPVAEVLATDLPAAEAPIAVAPVFDVPAFDVPASEVPITGAPVFDVPGAGVDAEPIASTLEPPAPPTVIEPAVARADEATLPAEVAPDQELAPLPARPTEPTAPTGPIEDLIETMEPAPEPAPAHALPAESARVEPAPVEPAPVDLSTVEVDGPESTPVSEQPVVEPVQTAPLTVSETDVAEPEVAEEAPAPLVPEDPAARKPVRPVPVDPAEVAALARQAKFVFQRRAHHPESSPPSTARPAEPVDPE